MAGKGATKKPGARSSGMKIKKGDHVIVIAGRDNAARARSSRRTRTSSRCWSRAST
jgi:hypothetical protein